MTQHTNALVSCITDLDEARALLRQGKVIAYPTEAVYGFGCDPWNQAAVERLLSIKQRSVHQGLILLIADWSQLPPLITPEVYSQDFLSPMRETWPGPVTWIFPKSALIPVWISGSYDTVAIRMTAHPIAQALCLDHPVVSTSANRSGQPALRSQEALLQTFAMDIDGCVVGALGMEQQPSAIYDAMTQKRLR